ncbi:MAG: ABC transporter permease, partial [Muribaculaceae bacterium]|nr:ABC transporter permease [Muribaculaceae bacterium]
MMLVKSIAKFGDYCEFLWRSVGIPEKWREFLRNYRNEIYKLGIDSIPLILIISVFIGALCTILI